MRDWTEIMDSLNLPSVPALRGFNGSGELLATMGSGLAGMAAGGLRGAVEGSQAAWRAEPGNRANAFAEASNAALQREQERFTYQPRSAEGQAALEPVAKVGELWMKLAEAAGGLGDSPGSQTAIQTAVENADVFAAPLKAAGVGLLAVKKLPGQSAKGVGKWMPAERYVHRSAIGQLPPEVQAKIAQTDPGFDWHVAKVSNDGEVSLIESADFDTADFPTIGRSYSTRTGAVRNPPADPEIYHHKQTMVDPSYTGFDMARANEISRELMEMKGVDRKRYGRKSFMDTNVLPLMQSVRRGVVDEPRALWDAPDQKVTSADTSINAGKLPGGFTAAEKLGVLTKGQKVIDIGGGRFDNAVEWGKERGLSVGVFDPFNRSARHNERVVKEFAGGKSDVATINNVLNVIEEPANQLRVLRQAEDALRPGGQVVIKIYEGDGKGVGKATSKGYQQNRKTADYLELVREVFPDAEVKGGVIIARKPEAAPLTAMENETGILPASPTRHFNIPQERLPVSSLSMLDDSVPALARGTHTVESLADLFTQTGRRVWGDRDMLAHTPENVEDISDILAAETEAALGKAGNAGTWYRDNLDEAHKVVAQRHPEIVSDPRHADAFNFALAITSNQNTVKSNAEVALRIYERWKADGRFPEDIGVGESGGEMMDAFKKYNALADDLGEEQLRRFLHTEFSVSELRAAGFNVSGEGAATKLPGSVIFGPKIGGGFYQNLSGNFSPLTADRWWTRTFHRITGTLVKEGGDPTAQIDKFRAALDRAKSNPESPEGQFLAEAIARRKIPPEVLDDPRLAAQALHKHYARGGFKQKNDLSRASKNLDLRKPQARVLPESPAERDYMRAVAARTVEKLRGKGYNLDTADMQALVWFPEQDLWKKMGYPAKPDEVRDYAAAFRQLIGDAGAGSPALPGNVGKGSGRSSTQVAGFTPEERARFLRQRATAAGANARTLRRLDPQGIFAD